MVSVHSYFPPLIAYFCSFARACAPTFLSLPPPSTTLCTFFCSRKCNNNHGLIRKYNMMLCRRCFRENATQIGFIKVRYRGTSYHFYLIVCVLYVSLTLMDHFHFSLRSIYSTDKLRVVLIEHRDESLGACIDLYLRDLDIPRIRGKYVRVM